MNIIGADPQPRQMERLNWLQCTPLAESDDLTECMNNSLAGNQGPLWQSLALGVIINTIDTRLPIYSESFTKQRREQLPDKAYTNSAPW